jgi:hypothetical protein
MSFSPQAILTVTISVAVALFKKDLAAFYRPEYIHPSPLMMGS